MKVNRIRPLQIRKAGRSKQRPYKFYRPSAPTKYIGSDTTHRTPKGGGAKSTLPFEAQGKPFEAPFVPLGEQGKLVALLQTRGGLKRGKEKTFSREDCLTSGRATRGPRCGLMIQVLGFLVLG